MKRGLRKAACGAFIVSALASAAPAQTNPATRAAPSSPHETVTVTAGKPLPEQLTDTVIAQFVDQHGAKDRKTGQFVRELGVCPLTVGMPPAFNDFVTARVLTVAGSVGARTQEAGKCRPNIEIVFTDEPGKVLNDLYRRTRGVILGVHYVHEEKFLLQFRRAIQAWYVTGTRGYGGGSDATSGQGTPTSRNDTDLTRISVDNAYSRGPEPITLGSRIPQKIESLIVNALILVDSSKVAGQKIGPIADYVTMLALSRPQSLDDCNELPSILDSMASNCETRTKPDSLTVSDIAYLKALYAADLGEPVSRQEISVTSGMKGNLDGH